MTRRPRHWSDTADAAAASNDDDDDDDNDDGVTVASTKDVGLFDCLFIRLVDNCRRIFV